jgi:hypothetical protein
MEARMAATRLIDDAKAGPLPPPIGNFPISGAAAGLWAEIERLDLARHIAELEVKGYTVVPPEKVAPAGFAERLLEASLDLAEQRWGVRPWPGMSAEETPKKLRRAGGGLSYALLEAPLYQEALLNPTALAFVTYLLGKNALLSSCTVMLKGQGGPDLDLHCDSFRLPDPLPALPQICNITWALTDYTLENGAIAMVPGSHRYLRRPLQNEGVAERVPVEAKAGSLIVFGGQVWHGAYRRTAPGFRCAVSMYMCRPHLITQERYGEHVPQAIIDRHPPRFATLMGRRISYGWGAEGPHYGVTAEDGEESTKMGKHAWD